MGWRVSASADTDAEGAVPDLPIEILVLTVAVFAFAGTVKGVVGLGLPTVSLALLTATLGLKQAIALMLIPSLVTNIWQALAGGALVQILRRLWPLLIASCLCVWPGTALLARSDAGVIAGVFGLLLCVYSAYSLATPQIRPPGRHETWLSPTIGAVGGVITGLTGSFIVPGTLYLQALGMPRDVLVQAMGVSFVLLTATLGIALSGHGLLSVDLGVMSVVAVVPTALGMMLGQRIRKRLPEATFRRVFFFALFLLGLYICVRAVL